MKITAFFAILISASLIFGTAAAAEESASEAAESTQAAVTRRTSAAHEDYVPEPSEEIPAEYRIPEGLQGRGELINLNYEYGQNGYPDYISYVAAYDKFLSANNEFVIQYRVGITDMSQENIDEVLELADVSCYIVFEQAAYSYNQRMEVFYELRETIPECYIIEDFEAMQFILVADEGETEQAIQQLNRLYGEQYSDLVWVADAEGNIYSRSGSPTGKKIDTTITDGGGTLIGGEAGVGTESGSNKGMAPIIAAIATALIPALGASVILNRKSSIKPSSDGTAAVTTPLTKREVKQLVKASLEAPPSVLRERIF